MIALPDKTETKTNFDLYSDVAERYGAPRAVVKKYALSFMYSGGSARSIEELTALLDTSMELLGYEKKEELK